MNARRGEGRVRVQVDAGSAQKKGEIPCVVGREIWIDPEVLGSYCFKPLLPNHYDLVLLAAAVAFADRAIPRLLSSRWARKIQLILPVHDSAHWRSLRVADAVQGVLSFLTGDDWEISFVARRRLHRPTGSPLPLGDEPSSVMPYSD